MQLRSFARPFLSFKVGKGNKISIWYDAWHPAGCLIEKYGYRTAYDAGHNIGPTLASIIRNGEWHWKSADCLRFLLAVKISLFGSPTMASSLALKPGII